MRKILAVSGGVDSIVMLDIMTKKLSREDILVAHFDHGIRENSGEDAEFVAQICREKGVECVVKKGRLGCKVSEAEARTARYDFLRELGGDIYTAHHLDDLVETVAINLIRGTGWRGLAVFGAEVRRPFLEGMVFEEVPEKRDILRYAGERGLRFREDQSNGEEGYLRNRVREMLSGMAREEKLEVYRLWRRQVGLRSEIDELVGEVNGAVLGDREAFRRLEDGVALELLRAEVSATRPQLLDFLQAIREYAPGKYFNLPGGRLVKIGKERFEI